MAEHLSGTLKVLRAIISSTNDGGDGDNDDDIGDGDNNYGYECLFTYAQKTTIKEGNIGRLVNSEKKN